MHVSISDSGCPATDAGRAPSTHQGRPARSGSQRILALWVRQSRPRKGRRRSRIHPRGAVSPLRREGGTRRLPWWTGSPKRGSARCGSRPSGRTHPVDVLVALARGHIVFCRRDIARVMMALRVEFDGREHPVGTKVAEIGKDLAIEVRHRHLRRQPGRLDTSRTSRRRRSARRSPPPSKVWPFTWRAPRTTR